MGICAARSRERDDAVTKRHAGEMAGCRGVARDMRKMFTVDGRRLVIEWSRPPFCSSRDFVFALDRVVVGRVAEAAALADGHEIALPDGARLLVQFREGLGGAEWTVTRDGVPVTGSSNDPATQVKGAAVSLYALAGLSVLGALLFLVIGPPVSAVVAMALALVYAVLANRTARRSSTALALGITIACLDSGLGLLFQVMHPDPHATPSPWGYVIRLGLIVAMARGYGAMKKLNS